MSDALQAGADRFSGFGGLYERVRPTPPPELGELLAQYAGGRPRLVVDLGSGTGLSARWASTWADQVIGIEPSDDMRSVAGQQPLSAISYQAGWSHATGLSTGIADVVLAVQALHWMEPVSTFTEVARLLRPGGVFAAIDCDWPPSVGDHMAEQAWEECRQQIRVFETRLAVGVEDDALRAPVDADERDGADYSGIDAHHDRRLPEGVRSWSKSGHLDRMSESGRFSWCREILAVGVEGGDADRFIGLLKSQGDYQTLLRHGLGDDELGVDRFERIVRERLEGDAPFRFMYRARVAFAK
jgi:SAM-dependent methyltransferase